MPKLFRLSAVVAACLLLAVSSARAYTVTAPGDLVPNSAQTFNAVVDLTGNIDATGGGAAYDSKLKKVTNFTLTAPTTHPLSLFDGPVSVSSNPTNTNGPVQWTLTDPNLRTLSDIQNLDVDLLNGQTADFALNTVDIFTNSTLTLLKDITIDVSGTLTGLSFDQTGSTITLPTGLGTGTFATDGILNGQIDNLQAVAIGLITVPVGTQVLALPGALTGTYNVTPIVGGRHIALDGTINLNLPLSLVTQLTTSISDVVQLSISTTIDLQASLTIAVGYHFETNVVPEPGSFVLLGLGLAALVPVFRYRRKK